jgi:hypothetical protein
MRASLIYRHDYVQKFGLNGFHSRDYLPFCPGFKRFFGGMGQVLEDSAITG